MRDNQFDWADVRYRATIPRYAALYNRNESPPADNSVVNCVGPWLIEPVQTYTASFDEPGLYQVDCTVNAAETVTVTVIGEKALDDLRHST